MGYKGVRSDPENVQEIVRALYYMVKDVIDGWVCSVKLVEPLNFRTFKLKN